MTIIADVEALAGRPSKRRSNGEMLGLIRPLSELAGFGTLRLHHEVLEPNRRSAPPHWHSSREEAVFVLSGQIIARVGDVEHPLSAGGVICFPPGPPGHEVVNLTDTPAHILVMSASERADNVTFTET